MADRLVELIVADAAATNGIILGEVLIGCRTKEQFQRVRRQMGALTRLGVTEKTLESAAILGFDLRRAGVVVNLPDLVIAASAIEHGAMLMHADSDFDLMAQHCDLKVESYVSAV